jgi:6-phosphogluconolactonase
LENASYLAVDGDLLYGVLEITDPARVDEGAVFAYDLKKQALLSVKKTYGLYPCHVSVGQKELFVSNYGGGSLSLFSREEGLKATQTCIQHIGSSVNKDRQNAPHVHCAILDPSSSYLAVCDLGIDQVVLYPYSRDFGLGMRARRIAVPGGYGPRHLCFSGDGSRLYVLAELANRLLVYALTGDEIRLIQELLTVEEDFENPSTAAAIHLSPLGNEIAVSNRGEDSIVRFQIKVSGELQFLERFYVGRTPRDFAYTPDGRYIVVANQEDNGLTVYKKTESGHREISKIEASKPACILIRNEIN